MREYHNFSIAINHLQHLLRTEGEEVYVGEWQAIHSDERDPRMSMWEINHVAFSVPIPSEMLVLQKNVEPNLPWAEAHFQERVGGLPLNPGEQYKNWPWYAGNVEEHKEPGKFSHTYMERFWPKRANREAAMPEPGWGIRYRLGDLNDVVSQMQHSPGTRQAYLPVWFPEDTGAVQQQRVPCSLGYHFLARGGKVDCTYFIRSCDFFRHLRDDIYLAARLTQWVVDKIGVEGLVPGNLIMHIVNLHCFAAERKRLDPSK